MTNATLRGKPDAGNTHVAPTPSSGGTGRFDEGEVAPCTKSCALLLSALIACANAADAAIGDREFASLPECFRNPPRAAAPYVWWHWMNGNVTKAGISADLRTLADNGFAGAVIIDAGHGREGSVTFASSNWFDHAAFAVAEARRLKLKLGIENCSGWSSSGGPWVTASNAMKKVVFTERRVRGPCAFRGVLPEPADTHGFYRDIAVVALPVPACECDPVPRCERRDRRRGDLEVSREFDFGEPRTITGFSVDVEGGCSWIETASAEVELQEAGNRWTKIAAFVHVVRGAGRSPGCAQYSFSARTARRFRVTVKSVRSYPRDHMRKPYVIKTLRPETALRLPYLSGKAYFTNGETQPSDIAALPSQVVDPAQVKVLSCRADGTVACDVPPGEWLLMRFGYAANGMINHPATKGGRGPEVDKFDRRALDVHFDAFLGRLLSHLRERGLYAPGNEYGLVSTLIDSYEVGTQNWTHDFAAEFERRKGYSPLPMLAAFSGRILGDVRRTENFLSDIRDVCRELFLENYARRFADRCHAAGLEFVLEGYGNGPFAGDDYMKTGDVTMGEFWNRGSLRDHRRMVEQAVRAGRAAGRKIFGAEAFTANPGEDCWSKSPFACKEVGDLAFEIGLNRFYLHSYVHQPWTDDRHLPGLTMAKWGTHFDRNSTWWPQAREWVKYLTRCQFLLQEGRFDGVRDGVPRRVYDDGTVAYFVRTSARTASVSNMVFSVAGRRPELWHPVTGKISQADFRSVDGGRTSVTVPLDPIGSVFVVFPSEPTPDAAGATDGALVYSLPLDSDWRLTLGGCGRTLERLCDWTQADDPEMRFFSGTGVYRKTFDLPAAAVNGRRVELDLWEVRELATVVVNGREYPALWSPPFRVDVTDAVRAGANEIEVRVTNLWCNRLIGDAGLPKEKRTTWTTFSKWKATDRPLPSGLLGPVRLESRSL